MGLILNKQYQIGRTYRILTKDQLTLALYNECKNIAAGLVFQDLREPSKVTQQEINAYLDKEDLSKRQVTIRFQELQEKYEVPLDFYLRLLYRSTKSGSIVSDMETLLLQGVMGILQNNNLACVHSLYFLRNSKGSFYSEFKYGSNMVELTEGREKVFTHVFMNEFKDCKYGVLRCTFQVTDNESHRTILFFERVGEELVFYYYEPHGTGDMTFSEKYGAYDFIKKFVKDFNKYLPFAGVSQVRFVDKPDYCLRGLQAYARDSLGLCQIFSTFWTFMLLTIIARAEANMISLPSISEWYNLITEYFNVSFTPKQTYNIVLIFASKLYLFYTQNEPTYLQKIEEMSNRIRNEIQKFKVTYDGPSLEELKDIEKRYTELEARVEPDDIEIEPDDSEYQEYERKVKEQQMKEKGKFSLFRKRRLFEQCQISSDCESDCCYYNEDENIKLCQLKEYCKAK